VFLVEDVDVSRTVTDEVHSHGCTLCIRYDHRKDAANARVLKWHLLGEKTKTKTKKKEVEILSNTAEPEHQRNETNCVNGALAVLIIN
jgi:hypothetical protein